MNRVRAKWDWLIIPNSQGNDGKAIIVFSEFQGNDTFLTRCSIREGPNELPGPQEQADWEVTFYNCKSHQLAFELAKAHALGKEQSS